MNFILRIVGIRIRFVFLALAALGVGFLCSTIYVPTEYLLDIYPLLALAGIFFFLLSLLLAYSVTSPLLELLKLLKNRCEGIDSDVVRPKGYDLISQVAKALNEYFVKIDDSNLVIEREKEKNIEDRGKLEDVISGTGSDIERLLSVAEIIQGTGDLPSVASSVLKSMNGYINVGWS